MARYAARHAPIEFKHPHSRRWAIVDIDEHCAYLYLTERDRPTPVADCWLFNICPPIKPEDAKAFARAGQQAPAAIGYVAPERCGPRDPGAISVLWSGDGHSAGARIFDEVLGFIAHATKPGVSRDPLRPGPYGRLWDQQLFDSLFPM